MNKDRYRYRGKRIDTGEWLYGSLISDAFFQDKEPIYHILDVDVCGDYDCWQHIADAMDECRVISSTVCQCAGRRGKNKILLFEGDIIEIISKGREYGDRYQVVFDENNARLSCKGIGKKDYHCPSFDCLTLTRNEIKVIGNIHEEKQ